MTILIKGERKTVNNCDSQKQRSPKIEVAWDTLPKIEAAWEALYLESGFPAVAFWNSQQQHL